MKYKVIIIAMVFSLGLFGLVGANKVLASEDQPAVEINNQTTNLVRQVIASTLPIKTKLSLVKLIFSKLNLAGEDKENTEDNNVSASDSVKYPSSPGTNITMSSISRDDFVEFKINFDLEGFGSDIYISNDLEKSFDLEIIDNSGNVVADEGDLDSSDLTGFVNSAAKKIDSHYLLEEDSLARFEVGVAYFPETDGFYSLRLVKINFSNNDEDPSKSSTLNPDKFTVDPIYVSVD